MMWTKIVRSVHKFVKRCSGHCDGSGGGGHCS